MTFVLKKVTILLDELYLVLIEHEQGRMKDLVGCACTIQQLLPLNLQYLQGVLKIIAIKKSHIEWIKFWNIHISSTQAPHVTHR